ncbi:MAG TPA: CsgG/HfaB family protein [Candidatus Limnocylindrales bacterium]|jgi:curli biogenesis system outer membrane secretion channel CsgG|nr:CsgG/HfaB family protein [Candidatus Limnocylindrales bacterium]
MPRTIRLICVFAMLCASCMAQKKKRVAVLDFDYGTVTSYVAEIYGTNQDVGKGISDLLVQKLVQDGKYSIIERKALDKILAEQNFNNSERANPATASKIGKILGVDAIIIGSVTKFGRDDKSKTIGGAALVPHTFGLGGVKRSEAKAVCGISARMVDVTTGEILAAVNGAGESKRSGTSLVGAGGGHGGAGAGIFDTSAKNFGQTLLGEAVMEAVTSVGSKLDDSATNVPAHKSEFSGLVADVSGNTIILNVGSKAGAHVGDKIEISRAVRTVKDPATGKVLKTITNKVGEATITEVDADSATATFNGSGAAKVGDVAKTPQADND